MQWINFKNVSVSIQAKTGQEAYDTLCNALDKVKGCEWSTDTYTIDDRQEERSTSELFPEIGAIKPVKTEKVIQLNLRVKGLRTDKSREEWAQSLAEHILETFNDDESIKECCYKVNEVTK